MNRLPPYDPSYPSLPFYQEVESLDDAITLAREGMGDGRWDLFRGQTNAEWRVTSTGERLTAAGRDAALQRFKEFHAWARANPLMADYTSDRDSLGAIAQHYGLATMFVDFTDQPEIAGFFAADTRNEVPAGQKACIICVNSSEFVEFCSSYLSGRMHEGKPLPLPEIVRIEVKNLWRLQRQCGCFLWNVLGDIERTLYNFDRIVFPFTRQSPLIPSRDSVYPPNQSVLEQQLTRFFMNEQMGKTEEEISKTSFHKVRIGVPCYDAATWMGAPFPASNDWGDRAAWLRRPDEHASTALLGPNIALDCRAPDQEVIDGLHTMLSRFFGVSARDRCVIYDFKGTPSKLVSRAMIAAQRLWDGMRHLPYTPEETLVALDTTFKLLAFRASGGEMHHAWGEATWQVELAGDPSGTGAYSRASVSRGGIGRAWNPEFISAVRKHSSCEDSEQDAVALQTVAYSWQRFTFAGLRRLMVHELIPTQLAWRGTCDSEKALSVSLYYSPAEFDVFGPA
jgi:hypothetical protein